MGIQHGPVEKKAVGFVDQGQFWLEDLIAILQPKDRRSLSAASRHINLVSHQHPGLVPALRINIAWSLQRHSRALQLASSAGHLCDCRLHVHLIVDGKWEEQALQDRIMQLFMAATCPRPTSWLPTCFSSARTQTSGPKPASWTGVHKLTLEGRRRLWLGRTCRSSKHGPVALIPPCLGQLLPNLQHFNIINMKFKMERVGGTSMELPAHLVHPCCPALSTVHVSKVTCKGQGLHTMCFVALRQLQSLPKLISLSLKDTNVLDKCTLVSRTEVHTRLTTLTVAALEDLFPVPRNSVYMGVGGLAVSRLLPTQPLNRLRHLTLTSGQLSSPQLHTLLSLAPNLRSLAVPALGKLTAFSDFSDVPCLWESLTADFLLLNTVPRLPLARIQSIQFQRLYYICNCTGPNTTLDDLYQGCAQLMACPSSQFYYMAAFCSWHAQGTGHHLKALLPSVAMSLSQLAMRIYSTGPISMRILRFTRLRVTRRLQVQASTEEEWAQQFDLALPPDELAEPYGGLVLVLYGKGPINLHPQHRTLRLL